MDEASLDDAVTALRGAARVTALTGAGVSAASGVPTFRGTDGLWKRFRPEDLATPEAFTRDPRLVWEWYDWRRQLVAGCQPNAAHRVLAAWAARWPAFALVTQNVDDLHLRAGTRDLVRLHGSIWEVRCWSGCVGSPARWRDERVPMPDLPPRCPHCDGPLRPAVVWFGETLDPADVVAAHAATRCDVFITAGTSALVYPAAGFLHEARHHGATTIEINLEPTPASALVDIAIRCTAEDAFTAIDRALAG